MRNLICEVGNRVLSLRSGCLPASGGEVAVCIGNGINSALDFSTQVKR